LQVLPGHHCKIQQNPLPNLFLEALRVVIGSEYMPETSYATFNLGPFTVSFDTGIVDNYEVNILDSENKTFRYETPLGIISANCIIYKAIVTNSARNDGVSACVFG
jgi:hypothetical protein